MTLPITELGGLTDAEIQLRIEKSADKQAAALDQKLKEHRDEINRRLNTTDLAVRDVGERTSALKADVAVLMASDGQQTELLKQIVAKGDSWHEADIDFRAILIQRVSKIETEQASLAPQMQLLRWIASLSSSSAKVFGYVMGTENFRFFVVAGLLYLLLHRFMPSLVPFFSHLFHLLK